jgi:hypothetical protein
MFQNRDNLTNQDQETKQEFAKMMKDQLPALIAFANTEKGSNKHVRFEIHENRPEELYVISYDFILELSKFVK